jgi:hypothetical protein
MFRQLQSKLSYARILHRLRCDLGKPEPFIDMAANEFSFSMTMDLCWLRKSENALEELDLVISRVSPGNESHDGR